MSPHEVMVVSADAQEQRDLHRFLSDLGLLPSVVGDPAQALDLCDKRPFALAVVDVDTPRPGAGIELLRSLRRAAPNLPTVLLLAAPSFEHTVAALRAGASDAVLKTAEHIDYLGQRVLVLCTEQKARVERERLLIDLGALNEDFLRRLTDLARRIGDLRDQIVSKSSGSAPLPEEECRVLVVEEDGWLGPALQRLLPKGFVLRGVVSGGSALDKASVQHFHIALVKEALPDLPGRMVVRTLVTQSPETMTLLFSAPTDRGPGQVQVADAVHMIPLIAQLKEPSQLAERLEELRQAQRARFRERRYLAAFREENYELLRRHAELRQRLSHVHGPPSSASAPPGLLSPLSPR